jgi:Ca-activated chloride channel family protein
MRACSLFALLFALLSSAIPSLKVMGQYSGSTDLQSPSIIRVSSNLVMVPVSVTDAAGRAIANLDKDDFQIEEDGNVEAISKISDAGQSPLQLALLFDLSGSVNHRFEFEQQAAIRFLQKVWKPGDSITIVSFSEEPHIRLGNSKSLTDALQDLLRLQPTESATAFYDSVVASAQLLKSFGTSETRQAEIVLSDGEDNRSEATLADARRELLGCDTIFYSINPGGNSIRLNDISIKGQKDLVSLAQETGGTAFISDKAEDLDETFGRIANELRTQYLLSYYSSNPRMDGKFRRIAVSIPKKPDLHVRSRQGYFAVRKVSNLADPKSETTPKIPSQS